MSGEKLQKFPGNHLHHRRLRTSEKVIFPARTWKLFSVCRVLERAFDSPYILLDGFVEASSFLCCACEINFRCRVAAFTAEFTVRGRASSGNGLRSADLRILRGSSSRRDRNEILSWCTTRGVRTGKILVACNATFPASVPRRLCSSCDRERDYSICTLVAYGNCPKRKHILSFVCSEIVRDSEHFFRR